MKKQLVFYVSKIKTAEGKLFFRFTPNTDDEPAVWSEWDDQNGEPERVEKTFISLKLLLKKFSFFTRLKLQFEKEKCFFVSNPFADSKIETPFLDHHLLITEREEEFWRKLFLDLCIKEL